MRIQGQERGNKTVKNIYQCEKCLKIFDTWKECFDHEDNAHVEPDSYRVKPIRYLSDDVECCGCGPNPHIYPLDIHVPMSNGAVVQYTFDRVITDIPDIPDIPKPEAVNE